VVSLALIALLGPLEGKLPLLDLNLVAVLLGLWNDKVLLMPAVLEA